MHGNWLHQMDSFAGYNPSIKERIWTVMAESTENVFVQEGNTQLKLAKRLNIESWC